MLKSLRSGERAFLWSPCVVLFVAFVFSSCGEQVIAPRIQETTSTEKALGSDEGLSKVPSSEVSPVKKSRHVSIEVPTEILVGRYNQFRVWLTESDGSQREVTADSLWLTSNSVIAKASDLREEAGKIWFYESRPTELVAFYDNLFDFVSVEAPPYWAARDSMASFVWKDSLCFLGGWFNNYSRADDGFCSEDGRGWKDLGAHFPWGKRNLAAALSFKGAVYYFGGIGNVPIAFKDIWRSEDLEYWEQIQNDAPWGERGAFGALVFNDQLWLLGGMRYTADGGIEHFSDVWSSENGVDWNLVQAEAPWGKRAMFDAVAFKGKIWVLGGGEKWAVESCADIWSSVDGKTWTQELEHAPWPARHFHRSIVFDNKIFILAGVDERGRNLNDVWSSEDGLHWTQLTDDAPWSDRHEPSLAVFKDSLVLFGGAGPVEMFNDVWQSQDGASWVNLH